MTQLLPRVVSLGVESLVSLRRITDFLLAKEFLPSDKLFVEWAHNEVVHSSSVVSTDTQPDINKLMPRHSADMMKRTAFIEFQNVGARWPSAETKTLDGLFFRCDLPGLIMICGQVASGKSSLFMSLLNELPISEGKAQIRGSYGFCSQTAWIFSGTVRDNIIFGSGYNECRYKRILEVCALERDMQLLVHGDSTYIHENSLSGGQKARINLARCLYRDNDIYLLDDPFSAIDNNVSAHIFEKAVKEFLAGKLVLLATNQIKFLKRSDKILLLDQGKQLAYCSYSKLSKKFTSVEASKQQCFDDKQLKRLSFLTREFEKESLLEVPSLDVHRINVTDEKKMRLSNMMRNKGDEFENYNKLFNDSKGFSFKDLGGGGEEEEVCTKINTGQPANNSNSISAANKMTVANNLKDSASRLRVGQKFAVADKKCNGQRRNDQRSQNKQWRTSDMEAESGWCERSEKEKTDDETYSAPTSTEATSGSTNNEIHAPYGFSNLAKNEDKTLITIAREAIGEQSLLSSANNTRTDISQEQTTTASSTRKLLTPDQEGGTKWQTSDSGNHQEEGRKKLEEEETTVNKVDNTPPQIKTATTTLNAAAMVVGASNKRPLINSGTLISGEHYRTSEKQVQKDGDPMTTTTTTESLPSTAATTTTTKSPMKEEKLTSTRKSEAQTFNSHQADEQSKEESFCSPNGPVEEEVSANKLPGLRVWYKYYTQTSVIRLVIIVLTFLITQALFSTIDIYLTVWSLSEQNKALVNEITGFNHEQLNTFKHQAYINQHGGKESGFSGNKTSSNTIEYDKLMASDLPLSMSLPLLELYSYTDDSTFEMAKEIQKVSISPLSSRSSQLPFVTPMNNSFVPVLGLFYASNVPQVVEAPIAASNNAPIALVGDITTYPSSLNLNRQKLQQQQQQQQNQHQVTSNTKTNNLKQTTNSKQTTSSSGDGGSGVGSNVDYDSRKVIADRHILEESEAALNVKSIYRPLYSIVNNFTSGQHVFTYTILLIVLFSCSTIANVLSLTSSNKSAIALYEKLTDNALFAKIVFFDQNPVARFLNRATRDIGIIDEAIPYNANQAYDAILQTIATFIVVAAVDINLALPSLIILFVFLIYHKIHVKPTKDIQRLESISRSPIISHISTTLTGLHTIRATKSENRFEQLFMKYQDSHTSVFLLYLGCNRSMAVILDSLNATYTGIIAFWAVISGLAGPSAGLILTSAMLLSGLTQHGVMKLTETESLMTSVERVIEYCSLPQEENYDSKGGEYGRRRKRRGREWLGKFSLFVVGCGGKRSVGSLKGSKKLDEQNQREQQFKHPPNSSFNAGGGEFVWPHAGCVEYKHVDLYYNRLEKPVLKNISFKLRGGEKIAIIGRTGAGKSSIITTLFRLYDFEGTILIDGVDIKHVDLLKLRTSIGIIPQQPILFSSSVRRNLDPMNVYDDFSIWAALDKAHLRKTVSALPGKLDYDIGACNGGFSSGQKQLICLARVLLRRCSIIVMDEATANVDPTTDAIIQTTIRSEFKYCTLITIAHRLETILDYDRIMVLEAGRIVDFDTPERLASKSNSYFASLAHKSSFTASV